MVSEPLSSLDLLALSSWTNIYDTDPLRRTLAGLIDLEALADKKASPGLLVGATDVEAGPDSLFYSEERPLSLDYVLASGSLPPCFPMTTIDGNSDWDGRLFDNTPLGPVLDHLGGGSDTNRTIYVVNLFPNKAPISTAMGQVGERLQNLQFANRVDLTVLVMQRAKPECEHQREERMRLRR